MTGAVYPLISVLPETFVIGAGEELVTCTPIKAYSCIVCGLWSGFIIGYVTEVYTSNAYSPV